MNSASGGDSGGVVSITVEPPWWSGTKAFFDSIGTSLYDMLNYGSLGELERWTSGNLQTPRYDAQVEAMGDRLYNISKNLGYSDESIASGYGLIQAVGGEVTGMNMIAEAYEGYDLGENRALETDERVIKAAVGTAQAAGTVAAGLKITGVNPKISFKAKTTNGTPKSVSVTPTKAKSISSQHDPASKKAMNMGVMPQKPSPLVSEVLKSRKGSIKNAELPKGSPSWTEISKMTMAEIEAAAKANHTGFKTIKKLLEDNRFKK